MFFLLGRVVRGPVLGIGRGWQRFGATVCVMVPGTEPNPDNPDVLAGCLEEFELTAVAYPPICFRATVWYASPD